MDEIKKFIQKFIAEEFKGLVVQWTEKKDSVYEQMLDDLSEFFGKGLSPDLDRPLDPDKDWFKTKKQVLKEYGPRKLFEIKLHKHPKLGDLYGCYLSTTAHGANSYFVCLYVERIDGSLKIISKYYHNFETNEWSWGGGVKLEELRDEMVARKTASS